MAQLYGTKSSYNTKLHREHTSGCGPSVDVGTDEGIGGLVMRLLTRLLPRAEIAIQFSNSL